MNFRKGERNIGGVVIKLAIFLFVLSLQAFVFYTIYKGSIIFASTFEVASVVLQIITVIYILYGHERLAYKIPWLIFIMFMPVAGIIVYFLWGTKRVNKKMKMARSKTIANSHYLLSENKETINNIAADDKDVLKQVKLIKKLTSGNLRLNYFVITSRYLSHTPR